MPATHDLPAEHPLRSRLNDELHARPPVALWPHERILYLALYNTQAMHDAEEQALHSLLSSLEVSLAMPKAAHFEFELPKSTKSAHLHRNPLRMKIERHTEFTSWWFFEQVTPETDFFHSPEDLLPEGWLQSLPGQLLVATNVTLVSNEAPIVVTDLADKFDNHTLIGNMLGNGNAQAFTDFRLTKEGRTRIYVANLNMGSRQIGRIVQRLVEIETYRMMALLAFPVAQSVLPTLAASESEMVTLSTTLTEPLPEGQAEPERDKQMQGQISALASRIEAATSQSRSRFTASEAYYDLVKRRVIELQETNIRGIQGFGEFMERRLSPAMRTCQATARRLDDLSKRISRLSQLLQTRVEIEREEQNSRLLSSMDQRAKMQLRLQQTVEGLSVVAISYYAIGIFSYFIKAIKATEWHFNSDLLLGLSAPVIVIIVARLLHKTKEKLND